MATFGLVLEEKALIVIMANHLTNSQPKMVYTKKINSIIQNKKGNIIIGTTNGICQYDGQKFTKNPVPETLNITCLLEDKNENLWFGTMGNGVYRFNGSKLDNFQHSKEQIFNRGTKYQLILDILQDKKGNFWFSSLNEGGAWRYDGKELKNFLPTAEYYKTNQDKRKLINKQYGLEMSTSTHFDQVQNHITDDIIFSMMEIFGLLPETTVFVISMEKHLQVSG